MINSILFAQLGNKVNEIRNDNIGFYQGDYPEVTNVSDRFQTNPFEQINYAIVQQLMLQEMAQVIQAEGKQEDLGYIREKEL